MFDRRSSPCPRPVNGTFYYIQNFQTQLKKFKFLKYNSVLNTEGNFWNYLECYVRDVKVLGSSSGREIRFVVERSTESRDGRIDRDTKKIILVFIWHFGILFTNYNNDLYWIPSEELWTLRYKVSLISTPTGDMPTTVFHGYRVKSNNSV